MHACPKYKEVDSEGHVQWCFLRFYAQLFQVIYVGGFVGIVDNQCLNFFFHNGLNFLFITCYLDKQRMLDSMYVHLIDKSDSQCFLAAVVVVIVWYLVSNYLCNQCLMLWVLTPLRRGVLDTTLCDKVCQWLATDRLFSPGTPVSSTNTTDCHDITEILLKVA